ncbi:helix-turn-helix domain-containing protein [Halomonas sp. XH26]|uniref:YdaS family helix-turn-helix protein n=1 Tax=Halomonas sp. XH26 TaxID=2557993 RepID=UPI0020A0C86C|nr:YdaS family helix-turn-helix protein [Halomonas sp. XH26]UTA78991.1 helix-turn-helix domain-containing protein [Halomonas sp. XH26]
MDPLFNRLVDHFKTQTKAAEALGVDQTTVSGWVRGKHGMSPAVALRAEKITEGKFKAAELCPSVFGSGQAA